MSESSDKSSKSEDKTEEKEVKKNKEKKEESLSIEDRYIATMVLHAVGDTVGYKNAEWEFKGGSYESLEKLYEFIDLGGVNNISLKGWLVSDDTIMHMKTAQAILKDFTSMNTFGNNLKEEFLEAYDQFLKEGLTVRYPGISTLSSLKLLKEGSSWSEIPYNIDSGGSGASMRSLCFGLAFPGLENRDKLIQFAIESGRMTNNSAVGYLGAVASALFVALAIEGIKINEWPFTLMDLFKSGRITKYMRTAGRDFSDYERDHHVFVSKWHRYIDDKFDDNHNPIIKKSSRHLISRNKYYMDTFGQKRTYTNQQYSEELGHGNIGSGGDDSVIIAYDCLLDSGNVWEKLVVYSMLHNGDTDTTGSIAAGLYGVLYGFSDIPVNFLENLEYKDELISLGKRLFSKFYKS
ncbi:MAG: ADP-ribosylglycohydrolase [Barrevirus sp.]|uniref:ADP-ribosylglycohydrolase n=1 Tax=Barrevirus sp. TaxID=2487763 RepID=A0A3G4ZS68_9VIRU|nr:MAG: ADP-ribosylglycohydrolase [Barrevirus sp.]